MPGVGGAWQRMPGGKGGNGETLGVGGGGAWLKKGGTREKKRAVPGRRH